MADPTTTTGPFAPPDDPSNPNSPHFNDFVDTTTGFFNNHPVLGNLLAATPWGGRIVGALGTLAAIQNRQQLMQQQKAMESQLSQVEQAGQMTDPKAGLTTLRGINTTGWRPESFRGMATVAQELTRRAAGEAAGHAQVMESPGSEATTQDMPYSPDRAERGGFAPPPDYQHDQGIPPSPSESLGRAFSGPRLNAQDRSGETAATATINPALPPTYRAPENLKEMLNALTPEDRALYMQAQLHGQPPDISIAQIRAAGRAQANSPEEIDGLIQGLMEQHNQLPAAQQVQMAGRLQDLRAKGAIAKKDPRGGLSAFNRAASDYQSSLEKGQAQSQAMAFKREQYENHKAEFQATLTRMDHALRSQDYANLDREVDNARQALASMATQIGAMQNDPTQSKVVEPLIQEYHQLQGRFMFLLNQQGEARNKPLPERGGPAPPPGVPAPVVNPRATPPPGTPRTKSYLPGSDPAGLFPKKGVPAGRQ